ncbi:proteasome ATPase [Bifidobacterium sp.]|uniref:proteasome ATPase n=1 Tax=Bifidobacterium sp. TaxID=41200 RepID=UPI0025C6F02F|nr:proteasome ATPase [Bifidobacterium sp.]MCH4208681.1 proteasome ATPase [Bifidobacterium sp.]MCI1224347.1 proteasome ATPase [Bifidobacterium sp.]
MATDPGESAPDEGPEAVNDRLAAKNHALAAALKRAGKELSKAKAQLAQLAQPPLSYATMVRVDSANTDEQGVRHASAEVLAGTRRLIVPVASNVNASRLAAGCTVLLNENMVLVEQRGVEGSGMVRSVTQVLDDGRLVVADSSGNDAVLRRASALAHTSLSPNDRVIVDPAQRFALELLPNEDTADLVLEEAPGVTFADIGGLDAQIERIRDAVQLPFLHRALFERYDLNPPKGVLLYGPPGNGKTLIAKAVAHALAEGAGTGSGVFLSVKGPELLNKYVGESERLIRMIFKRARERAQSGRPVIVFIDEMDSLLRTRGSGVSSDVETTIVPQFLAELDGVERLDNVIVIGASNRVDMIDPAVLRPGRLDIKIRIDRPDIEQARQIILHYLTDDLPLDPAKDAEVLAGVLAGDIFARQECRHIADLRDEQGRWTPLYLSGVVSGAMLRNIVDRAKTRAVKQSIVSGADVRLDVGLLAAAVEEEYAETKDSVLDADPQQWSRVNGVAGGRVVALQPADQQLRGDTADGATRSQEVLP